MNYTRLCFGALLGCERRHPPPSLLDSLLPFRLSITLPHNPRRRSPSDECANARPIAAREISGFLFGHRLLARALPLSHCGATPAPSLAAGFVLPAVALAPPRTHATRRAGKFAPTADLRRNWLRTLARRQKKSPYGL